MIIQQGSLDALKKKHLKVTWNLLNICNFKCPYCLDMHTPRSVYLFSELQLRSGILNIFELNYDSFEIYLLGGEPTLYYRLKHIVKELLLEERVKRIYLLTNGSFDVDFSHDDRVKVCVSVHPLSVDQIKIKKRDNVYFNLIAYPKVIERVREIYDQMEIDEITVVRKPPLFERPFEYADHDIEWILENDHNRIKDLQMYQSEWIFKDGTVEKQPKYSYLELNYQKYLRFYGMYCLNNALYINSEGYWRYACYDTKLSETTIFEAPIEYEPYFKVCNYEYCHCAGRLNIIKLRDKSRAYDLDRIAKGWNPLFEPIE